MNATEDKTSAAERPSRLGDVMMVLTAFGLAGILAMVTWWPDAEESGAVDVGGAHFPIAEVDSGAQPRPKTDSDIKKYKEWRQANRRGVINLRSVDGGLGRGSEPPIAYAYLKGLFEHLNRSSGSSAPCDRTLSRTRQYLLQEQP